MIGTLHGRLAEPLDPQALARVALRALVALVLVSIGYLAGAAIGGVAPFESGDEGEPPALVMAALPQEFVLPPEATLERAGEGETLPYALVWQSRRSPNELAQIYAAMIQQDRWELMFAEELQPSYRVRLSRIGDRGEMTHWAMLDVTALEDGGSRVSFEFILTDGTTPVE